MGGGSCYVRIVRNKYSTSRVYTNDGLNVVSTFKINNGGDRARRRFEEQEGMPELALPLR